ncbi:MAG: hypothetical protein ACYC0V_10990 [Armatimonadota bacterium]
MEAGRGGYHPPAPATICVYLQNARRAFPNANMKQVLEYTIGCRLRFFTMISTGG